MRARILLMLALVMGGITTYLFFSYMKQFDTAAAVNETTETIVAARQTIQRNEVVTADKLQLVKVPAQGIHPGTLRSIADAQGAIAAADLAQGEPILTNHLKQVKDETLVVSRKVREGYRAVSVGVNFVQTVSNLIEPEDSVDVIWTETDKATGKMTSTLLLQNIRVLAVGRRMVEAVNESAYAEYSAVTLEVKPEEAVTVVNADESGSISLALHSSVKNTPPAAAAGQDAEAKKAQPANNGKSAAVEADADKVK